jgi:hypothetical protein
MPGKKMTVTKSTTTTKKGGPGVKVAPKGTTMGTAQRTEAKKATPVNSQRNGVWPTPENVKKGYK